jgi:hypothetical protein
MLTERFPELESLDAGEKLIWPENFGDRRRRPQAGSIVLSFRTKFFR